jgi:mono/diheme cytochrome c family protein
MRNQRPTFRCIGFAGSAALIVVLVAASRASAQSPTPNQGSAVSDERAFLKQYCQTCHNAKARTADLTLDTLDLTDIPHSGETMEKVIRKVWSGSMPPAQMPQPDKAAVNKFLVSMETSLDVAAAAHPNPGRPTMLHRLNRTEYLNAVRELFDVNLTPDDAARLPADDLSYGFDNNGDILGIPPLQLERYLSVAQRVSTVALGPSPTAPPAVFTHAVTFGPSQKDWKDGMPVGTRGGTSFDYQFPGDGEYTVKLKLQRNLGNILGFSPGTATTDDTDPLIRHRLVVAVDGKPTALFLIGQDLTIQEKLPPPGVSLADLPEPPAKQLTRVEALNRIFDGDDGLEFRFTAKAGVRHIAVGFVERYMPLSTRFREPYAEGQGGDVKQMGVYSVAITGPFHSMGPGDTPSRRRILTCTPATPKEETGCVRAILSKLARRAYRRPVTKGELQELLAAYEIGRGGGTFESGFDLAIRQMLMDPAFLFREEYDPVQISGNTPYRISDLELASRLSFFLWSGIPDDELLNVAESGKLGEPRVLEHQVRRMLADARANSLVTNFASEWLGLRMVEGVRPDPVLFSDFDGLKPAFQRETSLLLQYVLLGDRDLRELLNANYTFLNERLAKHYNIPNVYGDEFRLVPVSDGIRGGLLGQGGILTATAYPNRTSVVLRGKWVLDAVLGSPPAPPPPNIPPLPEEQPGKVLSMRERMAEHRKSPACAGCHSRMDPIGFALENFDATGKWRAGESSGLGDLNLQPIDASGQFPDGTKFNGVADLKKILVGRSDEFIYNMSEKLLTYALGRGAEWYDAPVIRAALGAAKRNDYRFSSIVLSLVNSVPFQMRMPKEPGSLQAESQTQSEGKTSGTNLKQRNSGKDN